MWWAVVLCMGHTFFVGGASSRANPLASRLVPGLHLCEEPDTIWRMTFPLPDTGLEIVRTQWESRMAIPIGLGKNVTTWRSCGVVVNPYWGRILGELRDGEWYLRLYSGAVIERVAFARQGRLAQWFGVRQHPTSGCWRVESGNFVGVTAGVRVVFEVEFIVDSALESCEVAQRGVNEVWVASAMGVGVVALLVSVLGVRFVREPEWRMGPLWNNCVLFVGCGSAALTYLFWAMARGAPASSWSMRKVAAGACVVGAVFQGWIGRYLVLRVDEMTLAAVYMGFYLVSWFGFDAVNVLFIRGSFRGWGLVDTVVQNGWILCTTAICTAGVGRLVGLVAVSEYRPPWNLKVVEHRRAPLSWVAERALACVLGLALAPASEHAYAVVFYDVAFSARVIAGPVLLFAALSWLTGVVRTFARIQLRTANWAFDHASMALLGCVAPVSLFLLRFVNEFGRPGLQLLGYCTGAVALLAAAPMVVGTFASFVPAAIIAHAAGRRHERSLGLRPS